MAVIVEIELQNSDLAESLHIAHTGLFPVEGINPVIDQEVGIEQGKQDPTVSAIVVLSPEY